MKKPRTTRRDFISAIGAAGIAAPLGVDAAVNWTGKLRIVQGPMVGVVTDESALVWARVGGEYDVKLEVIDDSGVARFGPTTRSFAQEDFCVKLAAPRLQADTRYQYRIFIDGEEDGYLKDQLPCYLKTAPAVPRKFSAAFGSCAKFQDDPVQEIWKGVEAVDPDLFLWAGDNVYIDSLHESVMADCYRRQRDVLTARTLLRNTPQLAVWDDHDFCLNDQDRRNPAKETALKVFENYWANPAYGEKNNPGTYFRYHYAGVDFFFIDVRYYRDPNDAPDDGSKTMLGERQLEWLKEGLTKSDAAFKILVSGSGWSQSKGPDGEAWSSHMSERNDLFDFIVREAISGVVLISGDTHVGEFNCIPWSENGGYDFYEMVSSPLAQKTEKGDWIARRPEIRLRQVYSRSTNFGLLSFDMEADDPTLTLTLHDATGMRIFWRPVTLRASDLVNGKATWRDQIDKLSLARHESWLAGGPYYIPKVED